MIYLDAKQPPSVQLTLTQLNENNSGGDEGGKHRRKHRRHDKNAGEPLDENKNTMKSSEEETKTHRSKKSRSHNKQKEHRSRSHPSNSTDDDHRSSNKPRSDVSEYSSTRSKSQPSNREHRSKRGDGERTTRSKSDESERSSHRKSREGSERREDKSPSRKERSETKKNKRKKGEKKDNADEKIDAALDDGKPTRKSNSFRRLLSSKKRETESRGDAWRRYSKDGVPSTKTTANGDAKVEISWPIHEQDAKSEPDYLSLIRQYSRKYGQPKEHLYEPATLERRTVPEETYRQCHGELNGIEVDRPTTTGIASPLSIDVDSPPSLDVDGPPAAEEASKGDTYNRWKNSLERQKKKFFAKRNEMENRFQQIYSSVLKQSSREADKQSRDTEEKSRDEAEKSPGTIEPEQKASQPVAIVRPYEGHVTAESPARDTHMYENLEHVTAAVNDLTRDVHAHEIVHAPHKLWTASEKFRPRSPTYYTVGETPLSEIAVYHNVTAPMDVETSVTGATYNFSAPINVEKPLNVTVPHTAMALDVNIPVSTSDMRPVSDTVFAVVVKGQPVDEEQITSSFVENVDKSASFEHQLGEPVLDAISDAIDGVIDDSMEDNGLRKYSEESPVGKRSVRSQSYLIETSTEDAESAAASTDITEAISATNSSTNSAPDSPVRVVETDAVRGRVVVASKSMQQMLADEERFWQRQVKLKEWREAQDVRSGIDPSPDSTLLSPNRLRAISPDPNRVLATSPDANRVLTTSSDSRDALFSPSGRADNVSSDTSNFEFPELPSIVYEKSLLAEPPSFNAQDGVDDHTLSRVTIKTSPTLDDTYSRSPRSVHSFSSPSQFAKPSSKQAEDVISNVQQPYLVNNDNSNVQRPKPPQGTLSNNPPHSPKRDSNVAPAPAEFEPKDPVSKTIPAAAAAVNARHSMYSEGESTKYREAWEKQSRKLLTLHRPRSMFEPREMDISNIRTSGQFSEVELERMRETEEEMLAEEARRLMRFRKQQISLLSDQQEMFQDMKKRRQTFPVDEQVEHRTRNTNVASPTDRRQTFPADESRERVKRRHEASPSRHDASSPREITSPPRQPPPRQTASPPRQPPPRQTASPPRQPPPRQTASPPRQPPPRHTASAPPASSQRQSTSPPIVPTRGTEIIRTNSQSSRDRDTLRVQVRPQQELDNSIDARSEFQYQAKVFSPSNRPALKISPNRFGRSIASAIALENRRPQAPVNEQPIQPITQREVESSPWQPPIQPILQREVASSPSQPPIQPITQREVESSPWQPVKSQPREGFGSLPRQGVVLPRAAHAHQTTNSSRIAHVIRTDTDLRHERLVSRPADPVDPRDPRVVNTDRFQRSVSAGNPVAFGNRYLHLKPTQTTPSFQPVQASRNDSYLRTFDNSATESDARNSTLNSTTSAQLRVERGIREVEVEPEERSRDFFGKRSNSADDAERESMRRRRQRDKQRGYHSDHDPFLELYSRASQTYHVARPLQHAHMFETRCQACTLAIDDFQAMNVNNLNFFWHHACFFCVVCRLFLQNKQKLAKVRVIEGRLHCRWCFSASNGEAISEV